jgi:serine/threonine-protein kinase
MTKKTQVVIEKYIGRTLGTVTIVKFIGQGTSGAVFLGFQRTLKRQVAVKVLQKTKDLTERSTEMFAQEAELVASLTHPNIIPIFEMGEESDCYYQVMQLANGNDLETVIKKYKKNPVPTKRTMPLENCLIITSQVLDGLGYAHNEGVVHHDIKPANILLDAKTGRPLITDFGIATTLRATIDSAGVIQGSPLYMAPEQVLDSNPDHRSDIYSVGMMLYNLIAGTIPLAIKDVMGLLGRKIKDHASIFSTSPSEASRNIDKEMERIICIAIHENADRRYQSCDSFNHDLKKYRDKRP